VLLFEKEIIRKFKPMKTTLLSILMVSVLLANAQKEKKPTPVKEKFVTIRMSKLPIAEFPKNSIPVSGIHVIQSVSDSFRMGYTLKGMDNLLATLKFARPLGDILQEQVKRMYKHEFKKDGAEILWVIKNLRFGERPGSVYYSYTRFNADAYITKGKNNFEKVCTIDTVFVIINGGDHGSDIEHAFRVLLKRTLLAGKELPEQNAGNMTIEQIAGDASHQINTPILTDSKYLEGAYASFQEFLENKPSITDYETVVNKKKKIKLITNGQDIQKDTLEIWGLCKDGQIYKYHQAVLIPLEKQDAGFIISHHVNETRVNGNMSAVGIIGAVGGTMLLGFPVILPRKVLSNNLLLVESIPYIDDREKQPVAGCIDMKTGEFTF
jgi:hypothetical protein